MRTRSVPPPYSRRPSFHFWSSSLLIVEFWSDGSMNLFLAGEDAKRQAPSAAKQFYFYSQHQTAARKHLATNKRFLDEEMFTGQR